MRRRLFWTIAGVAIVSGLLVLIGATVATQRAAVEATRRELAKSTEEVLTLVDEAVQVSESRPQALVELFRFLEGDLGPTLGSIRRTAGGSDLAFAAIASDGTVQANSDLFGRLDYDLADLTLGESVFLSTDEGELVSLTATTIPIGGVNFLLVVALARDTPVVRFADLSGGFLLIGVVMVIVSAALATFLSKQVISRLEPLSEASRRLAGGDLTARVPDLNDPDLDRVGESFNEMATEIEATRDRERQFLLGIGHDLRTPLTTIAGYSEALEGEDLDPEDVARIGAVMGVQSRQLGRLIEDLTLLARLAQPEFGLREEQVDIGAHVAEIVSGFQRTATKAGVTIETETVEGLMIATDPDRLGQIAQNLVENALRYTPEGGRVTVSVVREGEEAVLSVADNGIGIDAEDLPHIFDRHYVGKQRRLRNEGTGLGLSIVEGLAERLGGSVSAESQPGKGTRIAVRLPAGST